MNTGNISSFGEKLKEIREARGVKQNALAESICVTPQAVSAFERNLKLPSSSTLDSICKALSVPRHFFLQQSFNRDTGIVFYRSLSAATKTARSCSENKYKWLRDIVGFLRSYVEFITPDFPDIVKSNDPTSISQEDIENIAKKLRSHWELGDGPISNMVDLLEKSGGILVRQDLKAKTLDAFSNWHDDPSPYFVLGKAHSSAVRSRFDAAHELAHIILHRHVEKRLFNEPSTFKLIEEQAHYFAGAFLLPPERFSGDFYRASLLSLEMLKSKWKVSIGAIIKRLRNLDLITSKREKSLFIQLRRHYGVKEPLDDEIPMEQPSFIRRSFDMLFDKGIITVDELKQEIPLYLEDIEEVIGMGGYFEEKINGNKFPRLMR